MKERRPLSDQLRTLDEPEAPAKIEARSIDARELRIAMPPPNQARLIIHDGFVIEFAKAPPNRWCRFWGRVLLGWRWERL
jgi:hypothetical protein